VMAADREKRIVVNILAPHRLNAAALCNAPAELDTGVLVDTDSAYMFRVYRRALKTSENERLDVIIFITPFRRALRADTRAARQLFFVRQAS
jgi:hypothetical protein